MPTWPSTFPFYDPTVGCCVEDMQVADLRQVMDVERLAFPSPWSVAAYRHEITRNELSTYLVLRIRDVARLGSGLRWPCPRARRPSLPILGYGGFWLLVDEAHISTLALHPDWRGRGLGEMLLVALIDAAILRGAKEVTLEVRLSNAVAQSLYSKYGFAQVGRRKGYYHDNGEDALIMTTPRVDEPRFAARYRQTKEKLRTRLVRELVCVASPNESDDQPN